MELICISSRLIFNEKKVNPALLRYWWTIDSDVTDVLWHRTPVGNYVVEGILHDAFQAGFDVIDKDDTPLLEESSVTIQDIVNKYIGALATKRAKGFCILVYLKVEGMSAPELYWISPDDIYDLRLEPLSNRVVSFSFTPNHIETVFTKSPITINGAKLDNVRLMGGYDSRMGRFRSYIEPIHDDLVSLSNLNQQGSILNTRVGSGIRLMKVPDYLMDDTEARTKYEKMMENMGMNTIIGVPTSAGEGQFDFELNFGEGQPPFNILDMRNLFLQSISSYTGIPYEKFIGSELGLRSAETNRQGFLNLLGKVQRESERDLLWMISKALNIDTSSLKIRWRPLVEQDEKEVIALLNTKLSIVSNLRPHFMALGIKQEELYGLLGIDLSIDQSMIAKGMEMQKAIATGEGMEGKEEMPEEHMFRHSIDV